MEPNTKINTFLIVKEKINKYIWERKGIHLASALIPLSYLLLSKLQFIFLVSFLLCFALIVEFLRFRNPTFQKLFFRFVGRLLWKEEDKRLTGATALLIGALICAIFLPKQIVITVLLFLAFGDTFAYLVGHTFGKIKICGEKTLEGTLAFLVVSIIIVFLVHNSNLFIGIIGAVVGCIVELFPWDIDDNLSIPLISGLVMEICLIVLNIKY